MTRYTDDAVGHEARVRAAALVRADNARDHSLARPTTDPALQAAVAEVRAYEHDVDLFATMELPVGADSAYRDRSLAECEHGLGQAQYRLAGVDGRSITEILYDADSRPTRDERVTLRALAAVRRDLQAGIDDPPARAIDAAEAERDRQEAAYDLAADELDQARITGGDVAVAAQRVLVAEDHQLDAENRMLDLDDAARRIEPHPEVIDRIELDEELDPEP